MARLNAAWYNFTKRGQAWDHFWQDAASAAPPAGFIPGFVAVGQAVMPVGIGVRVA